ncbi:inorganic phosphate transporter [Helcobacillus massiliensis]|uniref:inorganic phosphate transporter n=1 Tax=Helcobacillus massiliensis TaxID=521392 RepID=UPI0021A51A22|nr:inorganic phosphate transporter [Helcobacillus massiliensis]MCT1558070.1 inorganic phosphate transporter [Helcobacillus massiliensis]MCT2036631.1 inorganic phosphate transporter [Helcobacillus massiliensis]MCT2332495.1 inorganic phosphate transporter [Helcobacillus massiliensis]MDK7741386.1 anion permease [Helcobacillus massiliensis]WOO92767.1 anion permease [Helcobacillus massiliensis]
MSPTSAPAPDVTENQGFLGADRWWHLAFGSLMAVTLIVFTLWTRGHLPNGQFGILIVVAILLGLFMAFNIGGNDVANSFGTSVGAGTLTMKQALLIAAVFEVSGALLAGGEVTDTVKSGIVDIGPISADPMQFVYIMMAALFGAAVWLLVATKFGLPVSTTHSIIGAIVGASLVVGYSTHSGGLSMVQWDQIVQIAVSWVLSPVLGGIVAYALFWFIRRYILLYNRKATRRLAAVKEQMLESGDEEEVDRITSLQALAYSNRPMSARERAQLAIDEDVDLDAEEAEHQFYRTMRKLDRKVDDIRSHRALTFWVPLLGAFGAVMITAMLLFKGLKNTGFEPTTTQAVVGLAMVAVIAWMSLFMFANSLQTRSLSRATFILFAWMQVFTASAFAFSHGSNDIANAIGPFAAVLDVLATGEVGEEAMIPLPVLVAFGIALVAGLWFIGRNVIQTVGSGLTKMHPSSGFAAELAAATVVMGASQLGLPVSSTHILIGAVLGVGMVNRAANWRMMRPIALAWIVTLPVAAVLGAIAVTAFRTVF